MTSNAKPDDAESFFELFLGFYNSPICRPASASYRLAAQVAAERGIGVIPLSRIRNTLRQAPEVAKLRNVRGRK